MLGEASSGASSDLAGATDLATRMVREYGMSERLGPVGFASGSPMYLGTEQVRSRDYAEATQRVIDEEVSDLLKEAEKRALTLLTEHRDALDRLVDRPGRARDGRRRRGRGRVRGRRGPDGTGRERRPAAHTAVPGADGAASFVRKENALQFRP